jgi:hypothetical protein
VGLGVVVECTQEGEVGAFSQDAGSRGGQEFQKENGRSL